MLRRVLLSAGSVLRGDDAAGPLLCKLLEQKPASDWLVIDGGQTPEDELAVVRRAKPERIVFVDAAQMGLEPGAIRRLTAQDVQKDFMLTTHSLPMSFLLAQLCEVCNDVVFLGIQPASTEFFGPVCDPVRSAVQLIAQGVRNDENFMEIAHLKE